MLPRMSERTWQPSGNSSVDTIQSNTSSISETSGIGPVDPSDYGGSANGQDHAVVTLSAKPAFRPTAPSFIPSDEKTMVDLEGSKEINRFTAVQEHSTFMTTDGGATRASEVTLDKVGTEIQRSFTSLSFIRIRKNIYRCRSRSQSVG